MLNVFALSITGVVICVAMIVAGRSTEGTTNQPSQNDNLTISNKTQAFRIVSAARDGEYVQLTFRNDYQQTINAFTLSGGANSGVEVDFTHNDNRIAPGATYNYRVFAASLEPSGSNEKPLNLTVLDVVFEDGTGDGDATAIADIQNRRVGERIALTRIVPLLAQALDSRDSETTDGIARLKERISLMCESLTKGQSGEVLGGILHGKGYILGEIKQLEEMRAQGTNVNFGDELLKIQRHYDKKLQRLQKIVR
ncbi:MAG TPA: hypothetical protein VN951_14035 [Pyrinomonadaceae bacterium]|nr:hypothetical protein [Pyrinomonadaceae bacterium]